MLKYESGSTVMIRYGFSTPDQPHPINLPRDEIRATIPFLYRKYNLFFSFTKKFEINDKVNISLRL